MISENSLKNTLLTQALLAALIAILILVFLPAQPAAAEGWQNAGVRVHVVQRGETLSAIAVRYGTTVQSLMRWNSLRNANVIYVGQRLVVGRGSGGGQTSSTGVHVVRRGETLSALARRYGTTVAAIRKANGLRNNIIYVGQRLRLPGTGGGSTASPGGGANPVYHTVRRGDTLASIARRYGTSIQRLASLNNISNISLIRVGQRLLVKGSAPAATRPVPAGAKKIVVDISEQRCYRYQGGQLLNTWRCSTGMNNATRVGTFRVQSKLIKAYGSTWNIWMPYWLGIYWAGPVENGFHGLPWRADTGRKIWAGLVGRPATYGCIMLKDGPMKTLWEWADIGTKVVIRR